MIKSNYETHVVSDALLPFRFHDPDTYHECKRCTPNWHENIEVLVCTRGSACVVLDGRQYSFSPGDICVANAYCVHATTQERELNYHCLIVDRNFCEENGIRTSDIFFREQIRDPRALEAFARIVEAYNPQNRKDPFRVMEIRYAVLGFLRELCRSQIADQVNDTQRSASRERVKKAIEYIKSNYTDTISLQEVADHVGISKYYLSREFREFTGSTIFDTINMTRCTEAKRRIEAGASVSEAALSCGYENLSYFTRTFKKHLGDCPSRYVTKQAP